MYLCFKFFEFKFEICRMKSIIISMFYFFMLNICLFHQKLHEMVKSGGRFLVYTKPFACLYLLLQLICVFSGLTDLPPIKFISEP